MNECMNNAISRHDLFEQIKELDFAIVEMTLYLDTHPCDREALELFGVYRAKRNMLVESYERQFGKWAITADTTPADTGRWAWVDDPWPWECV